MRALVLGLVAVVALVGCGNSGGDGAAPPSTGAPAAGDKGKSAGGGAAPLELAPLPLKITVPPGGMGAMDMSVGDKKSVTVDIGGGASLNVSEAQGDLASIKKTYQDDKMLFPFKKFAKEGADMAIVEFENEGKTGYIGFTLKDVGGKKYVCKTTGLAGVPSAADAEKHLKTCDTLAAK